MERHGAQGTGWCVAGGGLVLLAASWIASQFELASAMDVAALRVGLSGGGLLVGLGVFLLVGFHDGATSGALASTSSFGEATLSREWARGASSEDAVRALMRAFDEWLELTPRDASVWNSFDQFAREMLGKHAGSKKVRCFAVRAGEERLRSLSSCVHDAAALSSARSGILGHVATTGRAYDATDESLGEMVHRLAENDPERWRLAWPVRSEGRTIGIIAVGAVDENSPGATASAATVLVCLEFYWRHLDVCARLRTARSTDRVTGVLTREEFFTTATAAVEESNRQQEPVVITALMLEGLRGLDDQGLWELRDALVQGVGQRLLRKLRNDDVVGRLSDDRFVFLMRRLDSALGRLIAKHVAEEVRAEIAGQEQFSGRVGVRLGLAGSGLGAATLDDLLASAWGAVDAARQRGEEMFSDARPAGGDHED